MSLTKFSLLICLSEFLRFCHGSADSVIYDLSTEPHCKMLTKIRTMDCRWHAGLNRNMDYEILGGKIAAYKIQLVVQFSHYKLSVLDFLMVRNNLLAFNDFFLNLIVCFFFFIGVELFHCFLQHSYDNEIIFANKHPPLDCYTIVSIQKSVKPILV